jgi:anaerobic selenocysteine-containing dehydrogenase
MPTETKATYCRICEALCGLEVDVDGEKIVAVRPDAQHPVSKGFACVKGVGLGALHHDPDRLNHPMKRVGDRYERISWAQATREIGEKLAAIRKAHGGRALGVYTGNPTFFNYKSFLFSEQLVTALGTPNLFASHSIDCNNKFDVSQRMYGLPTIHPIVDLDRVKFLVILGGNPAASQMSFMQVPNVMQRLKGITKRGGRVVVIDPRRNETAQQLGEHISIQPGTDAYLLLAMLAVVIEEKRFDRAHVDRHMRGFDTLADAVSPFTPERASETTGIDADTIRALARAYTDADGAALYMSTGVNMGPFGSVSYWALQCMNLITGNVDREGGLLQPKGPFDLLKLTSLLGVGTHDRATRDGRYRGVADALPAAMLAEEILRPGDDRIRALVVTSGNPVHSIPGGRMAEALDALDLLVCIDIYPSETTRHAHYLLPATDMLERTDYPLTLSLNQATPWAQYTERMVEPAFERREEWAIFTDLAVAAGSPLRPTLCHLFSAVNRALAALGRKSRLDPDAVLALLFRVLGDISLADVRARPHGMLLPPVAAGTFLGKRVFTKDRRVDLAPEGLVADLSRVRAMEGGFTKGEGLVLIGRREKKSHNSWMHNHEGLRQPASATALLHPDDARDRGIVHGDLVRLSGNGASLDVPVELTPDIRRGVVVMPHGFGHEASGLTRAKTIKGGNVNTIIPAGAIEPTSGQAIMLGHRVDVARRDAPDVGRGVSTSA